MVSCSLMKLGTGMMIQILMAPLLSDVERIFLCCAGFLFFERLAEVVPAELVLQEVQGLAAVLLV